MKTLILLTGCLFAPVTGEVISVAETSEVVSVEETNKVEETVNEVKEWVANFFAPDKVAMYLSWVAYIGTIVGLVANIKKLKQTNNLTLKNVSDEIKDALSKTVGEKVAKEFSDILPPILKTQEKTNEIMTIFAKILALSQENTPESRVAILNLIEQLGTVSSEIVDSAKTAIQESVELAEEAKKQVEEKLDEIIDSYDGTSI